MRGPKGTLAESLRLLQGRRFGELRTRASGRLRRWRAGRRGLPLALHVEASNACNLRCRYCTLEEGLRDRSLMRVGAFQDLIPILRHCNSVTLSGLAEPLINSHLPELVRIVKRASAGCSVGISTNGELLDEDRARALVEAGLDVLDVSIDGVDPERVARMRLRTRLDTICANLRGLVRLKQELGSATPLVGGVMVLYQDNVEEIPAVVRLTADLGIDRLSLNHLEPYLEEMVPQVLWHPAERLLRLEEPLARGRELARELGLTLTVAATSPQPPRCSLPETPVVLANGDVVACHVLAYPRDHFLRVEGSEFVPCRGRTEQLCFGNINHEPLAAIWWRPDYVRFRQQVAAGDFPTACGPCLIKHSCICAGTS